jgi:hypothetical protein
MANSPPLPFSSFPNPPQQSKTMAMSNVDEELWLCRFCNTESSAPFWGLQGNWENTYPNDKDIKPKNGDPVVVPMCDECWREGGFGWGRDNTTIDVMGHRFAFDTSFRLDE